jgi:Lon protease-like protein
VDRLEIDMPANPITLPLFPLNAVLFPGMTLPLRIFEPRYLDMVRDLLEDDDPVFGVLLIKEGQEVGEAAVPYEIGTTARIIAIERKTEDDLYITAVGEERFLVHRVSQDRPYLVGEVEPYPLEGAEGSQLDALVETESVLLSVYLELLSQAHDVEIHLERAPDTPETLAYLVAALLQVPMLLKQQLLSISDLTTLLRREVSLLRGEVSALTVMMRGQEILTRGDDRGTLSSN